MKRIKLTFISIAVLFTIKISAQSDKLQIGAEFRPRLLIDNGYGTPQLKGESTPLYITQRTRLNAGFQKDKVESYISLQDVRLWGEDNNYKSSGVYGNTESLSLHQGWVKLNLNKILSLKIGRQLFSYDDQRIISARNWNDYQVTYDALLAEFKASKHHLHIGLSYNAESKNNILFPETKFKSFDFIHYQYKIEKLTLSGIAVVTENTVSDSTENFILRGTYGTNVNYKTSKFNSHISAYYQHNLNNEGGKVSSFCFSAFVDYDLVQKLNLGIGLDYLSGNDETSSSTEDNKFDILYGRRHGWYGYMDYFSTTPEQGLQDYMAKLTYKPSDKLDIQLHYHYFLLASNKYDATNPVEKINKNLGHEVDLKLKWELQKSVNLECGYSIYSMTNTLKQLKKVMGEELKTPQYCYVALTVKPSVLFDLPNKTSDN